MAARLRAFAAALRYVGHVWSNNLHGWSNDRLVVFRQDTNDSTAPNAASVAPGVSVVPTNYAQVSVHHPCIIPKEIWGRVALHLKPRHLHKLILTGKSVKEAVDTEDYWVRVAFHVMWVGVFWDTYSAIGSGLDHLSYLEHMLDVPAGYYAGMELYIKTMRDILANDDDRERKSLARAPLLDLVRLGQRDAREEDVRLISYKVKQYKDNFNLVAATWDETLPMKMLVENQLKRTTHRQKEHIPVLAKFLRQMEDDPMPAEHKRRWSAALSRLFYDLEEIPYDNFHVEGDGYNLSHDICRFH